MASRGVTTRMKNKDLLDLFIKFHKGRYYKYAHNKNTLKKQRVSLFFFVECIFSDYIFSIMYVWSVAQSETPRSILLIFIWKITPVCISCRPLNLSILLIPAIHSLSLMLTLHFPPVSYIMLLQTICGRIV